jgi:hypothetical protein
MTIFLVERYLVDSDPEALRSLPRRLEAVAADLRAGGREIRYLDSTFVPGEEYCFCRFEADCSESVEMVNRRAGTPYARISEAVELHA